VLVDLLFDPFGGRWEDVRDAAGTAAEAGFGAVWMYDHLAGSVHGADSVLECWTTLTALAVAVPRIAVGSLVLNPANRDAGTLAVMAATLQHVSGGRLLLGLGAGAGPDTAYAAEQVAFGRPVLGASARRRGLEETAERLRAVWTGRFGEASGFLRPDPAPPIVIAGFGPKMAELAGRIGDGINTPGGPTLEPMLDVARTARERAGRDPASFLVTTSVQPSAGNLDRLRRLGVDRAIVFIGAPYGPGVEQAGRALLG